MQVNFQIEEGLKSALTKSVQNIWPQATAFTPNFPGKSRGSVLSWALNVDITCLDIMTEMPEATLQADGSISLAIQQLELVYGPFDSAKSALIPFTMEDLVNTERFEHVLSKLTITLSDIPWPRVA